MPKPSPSRPSLETPYVAPRNALEARLVSIWEEVLPVAPIGVDDDFFDLGGESLHAFAVIARVLRDFEVTLVARDLFACASVGAMAAVIAERQRQTAASQARESAADRRNSYPIKRRRVRITG